MFAILFNFSVVIIKQMGIQEFNSLLLRNAEGLTPFAISLTRDREAAKDLCQETLCKALVYRDQYEAGTNIRAWLTTIMRNIFINNYRRAGRKKKIDAHMQQDNVHPGYAPVADRRVVLQEVNNAVYHLPAIFKTACVLYLQGYKYQEIAVALNEPLGTIKSRIHFARKMLKQQISR